MDHLGSVKSPFRCFTLAGPSSNIILNETAEFCRNLGARQYNDFEERKKANNARKDEDSKNVDDELLDFEESLKSKETRQYEESRCVCLYSFLFSQNVIIKP